MRRVHASVVRPVRGSSRAASSLWAVVVPALLLAATSACKPTQSGTTSAQDVSGQAGDPQADEDLGPGSSQQAEVEQLIANQAFEEAVTLADRHLQAHPDDPGLHYAKGAALTRLGKTKAGRASLEQAIAVDAAFVPAYIALARDAAFGSRDYAHGLGYAKKAVKLAPHHAEASLVLAMIQHDGGDRAGAIETLEALQARKVRDLGVYTELGRLYAASQQLDKARRALRAGIEMAPPAMSVPQRLLLGRIELSTGDVAAAKREFEAALRAAPKDWDVKLAIARAYLRAERPKLALPLAQEVAQALPQQAPALVAMGRVQLALDVVDGESGALHWFDAALAQDAESTAAHYGRALALAKLGRCPQAQREGSSIQGTLGGTQLQTLNRALAACKGR